MDREITDDLIQWFYLSLLFMFLYATIDFLYKV